MTEASGAPPADALIDQLSALRGTRARERFLRRHRRLLDRSVVEQVYARVVRLARTDLRRAERLARAAHWIATSLADEVSRAHGLRAIGHVHHTRGEYADALRHYEEAREIFHAAGQEIDIARTLNGALQSLISLGRYDEALAAAADARAIFARHGHRLGLARLDSNTGNILYRQDRLDDALTLYRRAHAQLSEVGEPQDLAAALSNIAVVQISRNDFDDAVKTYREARALCERHDMPLLTLRADYNIADLYYLRGEYTRALDLYRVAHEESERLGDVYHSALCDLDRSGIYLELNLSEEAGEFAERARARFEQLGMIYEEAKAVTTLALTTSRLGSRDDTHRLFKQARRLFARERNHVWLALVDLYEALVWFRDGEDTRARRLCAGARDQFVRASMPVKTAQCDLLLARLALHGGDAAAASRACEAVFTNSAADQAPLLVYQAHCVCGLVHEARGERAQAYHAFQQADHGLEQLRNQLQSEALRVAFLEDKVDVYERLVTACLQLQTGADHEAAFSYIEKAKSRSLADLLAARAVSVTPRGSTDAGMRIQRVRQELAWHYRQLEQEELGPDRPAARRLDRLRTTIKALEKQLMTAFEALRDSDEAFAVLQTGTTFGVDEIRASLPSETLVLDYYEAMGEMYVCVLGHRRLETVRLGPADVVRRAVQMLQFQLAKFRLGSDYVAAFAASMHAATAAHLRTLHDALVAPVNERLTASHLVIVPHDVLHAIPFHALTDGHRYLGDRFTISYAPSASIYRLCQAKPPATGGGALVMGVPDALAPFIADEVAAVAAIIPDARVFVGSDATAAALHRHSAGSRFVHIATHARFRSDNAMFSSILLGDGPLSVYDLYQMQLSAQLVTLSGCGTGLASSIAGDEQVGLVRGLLYAGARAVLLTLWDVHDRATAAFMQDFYRSVQAGLNPAVAVQRGMQRVRTEHPHPFFWAPFILIGDAGEGAATA